MAGIKKVTIFEIQFLKEERKQIKQVLSFPLCLFLPLPIEIGVITREYSTLTYI